MPGEARESFEALALPHLEAVYRVARRLARREHEAEDLVQETFLKAYRAFGDFEMREFGVKPWLFRILNNTFLNRQARERLAPRAVEHADLERAGDGDGRAYGPPRLDFEHVDGEVKRAIEDLPEEFRSVLLLWATMELSYQEIADALGIPLGTVMSRLHRARQHLSRALDGYARERRWIATKDAS